MKCPYENYCPHECVGDDCLECGHHHEYTHIDKLTDAQVITEDGHLVHILLENGR